MSTQATDHISNNPTTTENMSTVKYTPGYNDSLSSDENQSDRGTITPTGIIATATDDPRVVKSLTSTGFVAGKINMESSTPKASASSGETIKLVFELGTATWMLAGVWLSLQIFHGRR